MNDDWTLIKPNLLINFLSLIRKVISATALGKPILTQREFIVEELVQMAMERAVLYNAKLVTVINQSRYEGEKLQGSSILADLPKRNDVSMAIEANEEEMLQEFAEILMNCA